MIQGGIEGTTRRYRGNSHCTCPDFKAEENDCCHYGCEFEFYVDEGHCSYDDAVTGLIEELYKLTRADILVDKVSVPAAADRNHCMQIKPDVSLKDHGLEISVPVSTREGVLHYIETIMPLIEEYGYTNEETGFHIHISTAGNRHPDFYRFMLLCDDAGLLSSWKPRPGYSQNVMDVLSSHTKREARIIKTKKGTVWNLERINPHHIEIKSIGGKDYHKEPERIMQEFEKYTDCFRKALGPMTPKQQKLLETHRSLLDSLDKECKSRFASVLAEAGILQE